MDTSAVKLSGLAICLFLISVTLTDRSLHTLAETETIMMSYNAVIIKIYGLTLTSYYPYLFFCIFPKMSKHFSVYNYTIFTLEAGHVSFLLGTKTIQGSFSSLSGLCLHQATLRDGVMFSQKESGLLTVQLVNSRAGLPSELFRHSSHLKPMLPAAF
jgi:hypothetical protein